MTKPRVGVIGVGHLGKQHARIYHQLGALVGVVDADPARAAVVTRTALNLVRLSAVLAWSIVPTLAGQVLSALGEDAPIPRWPEHAGSGLALDLHAGQPIEPIGPLVVKLGAADIARLSQRFAG